MLETRGAALGPVTPYPYLSFWMTAAESGELVVEFRDDKGNQGRVTAKIEVA